MVKPLLVVGNRNYSSWSLRPFMALTMAGIEFDQKLVRFGEPAFSKAVKKISKAGRVPVLLHKDDSIWDSLAIIEYAAETWPKKSVWPKNKSARANARSISAEMHSGFQALRGACPMNLRRPVKAVTMTEGITKDVARIESIWADMRKKHGKGGPFLFGKFSAADAMFAPVASRFHSYAIPVSKVSQAYMKAIFETTAFKAWAADAAKETWIYPEDEA